MKPSEERIAKARRSRCPRCGAQPYYSCHRTDTIRLVYLKKPHQERFSAAETESEQEG